MGILSLAIISTLLLGIIYVLQKGFNENTKSLESLNEKIKKIEDTLDK